jgi:hypothetical protein
MATYAFGNAREIQRERLRTLEALLDRPSAAGSTPPTGGASPATSMRPG